MPRCDEHLMQLRGGKYYTTMDLQSGYWQIHMKPDDVEKTAFVTYDGLFKWTKMPFGLTNAPATFQRTMQNVLVGLLNGCCLVYIDDIAALSATFWRHLYDLSCVWDRLRKASLKLKGMKYELCLIVPTNSAKTAEQKMDAVKEGNPN